MKSLHNDKQWLTSAAEPTHLFLKETTCRCGCGANDMQQRIVDIFFNVRAIVGKPIEVTSGFRCVKHNKKVGGKAKGQHITGLALDLSVPVGYTVDTFADVGEQAGAGGIGKYYKQKFCHLDGRVGRFRWVEL